MRTCILAILVLVATAPARADTPSEEDALAAAKALFGALRDHDLDAAVATTAVTVTHNAVCGKSAASPTWRVRKVLKCMIKHPLLAAHEIKVRVVSAADVKSSFDKRTRPQITAMAADHVLVAVDMRQMHGISGQAAELVFAVTRTSDRIEIDGVFESWMAIIN